MKLAPPHRIKKWRAEWLALALALLFNGTILALGYRCGQSLFTSTTFTAEESQARFDFRMIQAKALLRDFGASEIEEEAPPEDMLYGRALRADFHQGRLEISLENAYGSETYYLKIETLSGATPPDCLPDTNTIELFARLFSILSGGEYTPEEVAMDLLEHNINVRNQWEAAVSSNSEYRYDHHGSQRFWVYQDKDGYGAFIRWSDRSGGR